jgi:hypothetical protein
MAVCLVMLAASLAPVSQSRAAVPPPDRLLPDDTLLVVTAPDVGKLRESWKKSPMAQLWNDPAMKPFRNQLVSKLQEELLKPLERDLGLSFDSYTNLAQGQVTFAVIQNSQPGKEDASGGVLLLVDAKDKSEQLKKNLAEVRKKWVDAGRTLRTETIRNIEFSILSVGTNDVPKSLRKFMSQPAQFEPVPQGPPGSTEKESPKPAAKNEIVVGQVESLLIVGSSTRAVEKVAARMTGGGVPALGDLAAFQADQQALFHDAAVYGWANVKMLIDMFTREMAAKSDPDTPNPFDLKPEQILNALGLGSLTTIAFTAQDSNDGSLVQVFLGAPEAKRQGLCKLLAPEAKEAGPPPFVPADAVKFMRWRMDGQKAWATLEKMLSDFSPQAVGVLNFLLDSADTKAKEKDPAFDIRKYLIGNLGDDIITYAKAPRGGQAAGQQTEPRLFLLGSPNPTTLIAAFKGLLAILPQGDAITEREFLGRKIYSLPQPSVPLPVPGAPKTGDQTTLSFAASSSYLAISDDPLLLEEYLRSSDSSAKTLRETPGLADAAQKVGGMGTGCFGYENQAETTRAAYEGWRTNGGPGSTGAGANPLLNSVPTPESVKAVLDWADCSLLPPYEKVSKYFYFSVYAASAGSEGLTFKAFAPVPPALRK